MSVILPRRKRPAPVSLPRVPCALCSASLAQPARPWHDLVFDPPGDERRSPTSAAYHVLEGRARIGRHFLSTQIHRAYGSQQARVRLKYPPRARRRHDGAALIHARARAAALPKPPRTRASRNPRVPRTQRGCARASPAPPPRRARASGAAARRGASAASCAFAARSIASSAASLGGGLGGGGCARAAVARAEGAVEETPRPREVRVPAQSVEVRASGATRAGGAARRRPRSAAR